MSNTLLDTVLRGTTQILGSLVLPSGSVGATNIAAGANIETSKLVHRHALSISQANGTAVADAEYPLHIFRGTTGTIVAIEVAIETAAAGAATVDIDLELGNAGSAFASVLSAAIQLDNATVIRTPVAGTVSSTSAADGDILKVTVDATAGGGTLPQGLIVTLTLDETPA